MSDKTERKKHIESSILNLLESAVITSSCTKLITNCLRDIKAEDDYIFTNQNRMSYLSWVLSLRRNMAFMNLTTTDFMPVVNEESNKVYKAALAKYKAAEKAEEEFKKIYDVFDAPELTPEEFLKFIKEQ